MPKITSGSRLVVVVIGAALVVTQLHAADLPPNVSVDFQKRGCRIAPSFQKHRENVVRAELTGNGVEDWAVLCVSRGEAYVLVYADGATRAVVLGTAPFTRTSDPEQARNLTVVQREYVVIHNPAVPARDFRNDLRCLEDSKGMGSSLYCFVRGKWSSFQGAD